MKTLPSSRRKFIGSLALLSAGTAFGSVRRFVPPLQTMGLQQQWKLFLERNDGRPAGQADWQPPAQSLVASQGHFYEHGSLVSFAQQQLLAQPTWVYWSEEKNQPADLIISFFSNDTAGTKLFRLNRFELEALNDLPTEEDCKEALTLLKEAALKPGARKKQPLAIKASVQKDQRVHLHTTLKEKEFSSKKQPIFHI